MTLWARNVEPLRPLDAPAARASIWDASWPMPDEPASVGHARRLVAAQLNDWGVADLADLGDTAVLLTSELVTNALRHAPGPMRLNLRMSGSRLRCEVEDTSDARPFPRVAHADAEGGRGLEILDLLTDAWGSLTTATGKTTWFELAVPVACPRQPDNSSAPVPRAASLAAARG
ncbi:ATP-binding protein [Streptomyces sp. NPDC007861]|uniref:ATP-binding protein n=1 Tax=Streptomyces sp. NPDC007861 TaxID=3154893 RepID=UPI0033D3E699